MKKILFSLFVFALCIQGCKEESSPVNSTSEQTVSLDLNFYPTFGSESLALNKKYVSAGGDSVQLTMARFYLSEVALVDTNGNAISVTDHNISLVDFAKIDGRGAFRVTVKAKAGKYRGIKFNVGVPFEENHKDASTQTFPLSVDEEMYWSWNSGYIFHRIEGKVDSAGENRNFFYHIGVDHRNITVMLATVFGASATTFEVKSSETNEFNVNADYGKIFVRGLTPPNPMKPSMNLNERETHSFSTLAPLADRVLANIAGGETASMFSRKP